jgi:Tfp pilus assembly protein PilZ
MGRGDTGQSAGRRGGDGQQPAKGMVRVPFVRRCELEIEGQPAGSAFIVNINVLGAYVARDVIPSVGQTVRLRFDTPGHVVAVRAEGTIVWANPRQTHPVHSLPPGFGLRFDGLESAARERIEAVVSAWTARHGMTSGR